jgi:hypothetical protein
MNLAYLPQWWMLTLSCFAWLWLILAATRDSLIAGFPSGDFYLRYMCRSSNAQSNETTFLALSLFQHANDCILMTVAMMFPLLIEQVRTVAFSSPRLRRHRSIAMFLAGYTALWTVVLVAMSLCVSSLTAITRPDTSSLIVSTSYGIAALWTWIPARRRSLVACHMVVPLRTVGWRADLDCVRYGLVIGRGCLLACWASMASLLLVPHSLVAMAVVAALVTYERYRLPHKSKFLGYLWTFAAGWAAIAPIIT